MSFAERLRTMKIVAGALLAGVLIFMAVVGFIVLVRNQGQGMMPPQDLPYMTLVCVVFFVTIVPASFFLPKMTTRTGLQQMVTAEPASDTEKLWELKQTTLILSIAPLEGAAFFGCIAFMLEAHALAMGIAAAATVLILIRFPTMAGVETWVQRQAEELAEMRQLQKVYK